MPAQASPAQPITRRLIPAQHIPSPPTPSSNRHPIQNLRHRPSLPLSAIDRLRHRHRPRPQLPHHFAAILKTACAFHVGNRVALDAGICSFLLEDVDELEVGRVGTNAVDDGEGEFAFGEVFAEAFVFGVFGAGEVHVVIADLEKESDGVDEWDAITVLGER